MLHVSVFGCVQLDVVLGQDLHDGSDLQPPLSLGNAVPVADRVRIIPSVQHQTCS